MTAANRKSDAALKQSDRALRQAELALRGHVSELFNQAVGQLGDEKLEIRLGAIYTLRDIAKDFPDLTLSVFQLLNLFIRENTNKTDGYGLVDDQYEQRVDTQEIIKFLLSNSGAAG